MSASDNSSMNEVEFTHRQIQGWRTLGKVDLSIYSEAIEIAIEDMYEPCRSVSGKRCRAVRVKSLIVPIVASLLEMQELIESISNDT